ncbi:MAG: universal stress protein [Dehalococcoidia bacterium]|nr:universal stress protein [Dehalococcoidia bacterium]
MYEKILAPCDTKLSELILPYLEELGDRLDSEITLLHVYPPKLASFSRTLEVYLDQLAQTVRGNLKDRGRVSSVVLGGDPHREIVSYAQEEGFGLIVMATHGESGIKRRFLGSTADKVVRGTNQPVLLIRAKSPMAVREQGMLNRILVPLDGSKLSESILPYVGELVASVAAEAKTEVTLIQIIPPTYYVPAGEAAPRVAYTEEELSQLREIAMDYLRQKAAGLQDSGIAVKCEVPVGGDAEKIVEFTDEIRANLVAMSTHGLSGFSRLFLGSVADYVLHHGDTPLLLVKPSW